MPAAQNEALWSPLPEKFALAKRNSPLNPLSNTEIWAVSAILVRREQRILHP